MSTKWKIVAAGVVIGIFAALDGMLITTGLAFTAAYFAWTKYPA